MAFTGRGWAYAELGNYKQALDDFNKAIEFDPKMSMAYVNRGVVYSSKLGNHRQALEEYKKAIELDPKNALAYYNRGCVYGILG